MGGTPAPILHISVFQCYFQLEDFSSTCITIRTVNAKCIENYIECKGKYAPYVQIIIVKVILNNPWTSNSTGSAK